MDCQNNFSALVMLNADKCSPDLGSSSVKPAVTEMFPYMGNNLHTVMLVTMIKNSQIILVAVKAWFLPTLKKLVIVITQLVE